MNIKTLVKFAILGAAIYSGIQFSLVYINRTQLKSIMESEALDARRSDSQTDEGVINAIRRRAESTNVYIPGEEEIEFVVGGIEDDEPDIVIYADYVHVVDLLVYKVPVKVGITARADSVR